MPRFLTESDFRARRRVLVKSDFALVEGPTLRPSDKIDKATWSHIVTLADDVAIRTTNQHGKAIKQISDLTYEWLIHSDERDRIMLPVMLDAYDDFEAAIYTAITGYYRLANSAIRSALELVTIGTWAKVCGKQNEFQNWQKGKIELSLGSACDGLIRSNLRLAQRAQDPSKRQPLRSKDQHHRWRLCQTGIQQHIGLFARAAWVY